MRFLIGAQVFLCTVVFALAGSDLPPPRGFAVIVVVALLLGVLTGFAAHWPPAWVATIGWPRTLGRSALAGGGVAALLAILVELGVSAATPGPVGGSPSDALVFAAVVAVIGAGGAVALSAVVAGAARARSRLGAAVISLLPTILVTVPAMVVIAMRLAG